MERALEAELSDHLGYEKHQRTNTDNSRNGVSHKSVLSDQGAIEIATPRDRNGSFSPQILPKGSTRIDGLDDKIISLYAKGMSVADIQQQLFELYGTEISTSLISNVTNAVIDQVRTWQCRPLECLYMIVYVDCLMIKARQDKRIINKAVYVVLGVDVSGRKDILGIWINETEGAKFWLSVFTELKNRGLQDILIVCSDNLTGMSDAIASVYPKADHQLCIVHQIRNSMKYTSYKHRKALCADLKPIYHSRIILRHF
jgi:putative transposase